MPDDSALTPASTDAVNRATRASYSEVTGITQTARNLGASLGLAVLGTILVARNAVNVSRALDQLPETGRVEQVAAAGASVG
jgi:hypothetical protein